MPVNRLVPGILPRLHIAPRLWLAVGSVFVYAVAVALVAHFAQLPPWNTGAEMGMKRRKLPAAAVQAAPAEGELPKRWSTQRKVWAGGNGKKW